MIYRVTAWLMTLSAIFQVIASVVSGNWMLAAYACIAAYFAWAVWWREKDWLMLGRQNKAHHET
jgi:hypothetical protein